MYRQLLKPIYFLLLFSSISMGAENEKIEYTYIDELHKDISNTIVDWADILDSNINSWLSDDEELSSCEVSSPLTKPDTTGLINSVDSVDSFFQNGRYEKDGTIQIFLQ